MPAPAPVHDLVQRFDAHAADYRADKYKEDQLRQEFLNPLFDALGWDMANKAGYAEAYKDVIHEDAIKIGGQTKAPDYCFRIGGVRKFFLEAKKPAVVLKNNSDAAYQLRRYAWSAKLPVSVLTNFAELAVYDCRKKPGYTDKAATGRVNYYTHHQLLTHWDEIAGVFSKDAILKGSFDKYAESAKGKRGTATVDAAFLEEIEGWRDHLARNLAARNTALTQRELNFAVQVTIDRIIFLRMCEDRGIEPYGQLRDQAAHPDIYKALLHRFRLADEKYNSGLFHFEKEADRDEPDKLTPGLAIDDKVLKDILKGLYFPESPYEFSVLPADILGQVYEQFLGKVIRLTEKHQAKVEDKPEVKKAGGVYYTPGYIVRYIVEQTVGKLLGSPGAGLSPSPLEGEGRPRSGRGEGMSVKDPSPGGGAPPPSPRRGEGLSPTSPRRGEVAAHGAAGEGVLTAGITPKDAAKLRVLDPACGSGSFLLGAYQYLLDWHRDWYAADGPDKHPKELAPVPGGGYRLTIAEKKRILLANIYGVDIDPQAVEVTKLSLLLRVLEGETSQSLSLFAKERALPDLDHNIRCGNSLIGPDFYDGERAALLNNEEERLRINAFDWKTAFPKVMKAGGFDAVIGNPPYVRIQRIAHEESDYFYATYKSPTSKTDLSLLFLELGLQLINEWGVATFICTSQWLATDYGRKLRGMLADGRMHEIVDFGSLPVFANANTYPAIFTMARRRASRLLVKRVGDVAALSLDGVQGQRI